MKTEGDSVPQVKLYLEGGKMTINSNTLFENKTVVVFGLPGAFTPTCSNMHLPGYESLAKAFAKAQVDDILCISVNDSFVMDAWAQAEHINNVLMVPDGNGDFTREMGLLVDKYDAGLGKRSLRYSMLVRNCVIEKIFKESEEGEDPYTVSDAETMLKYIDPKASPQDHAFMIVKHGCPFCSEAKTLLGDNDVEFESIELGTDSLGPMALKALSGASTVPQIWINGTYIGGLNNLKQYLQ